ncbi:conjugal transfer mating pair stabilization protein TraG [Sphingobium wenxiniae]|uniref:Conjugal transfer mating pair stabilization protein TraG n=1 Tax=Sphingobium wenxiniae (strain DSM 21828 / CGMCC 1.7748 / JZ-1) TaxID=595605 RepID=A0A562K406_SPHWJ|nr:conjugal transfer protein TraG N-terminal domain-containing protein [Sphingobium wenxiniae]MBB6193237.1 conjugal transfer mating pair stabilization protein TraG [Sphingobium wenxiniae]MCF8706349.1 conjugal transfer protein TraG N-terminal domain-containing protein [Rhizorhapis sp. SPR117]TWH90168.1 conjugal transfer mating pair stabilization protein TraG [Sphingobium wenxiniae]
MLEVFTVGGGEYLVNIFNAVAAWSGGGGYRSLIRVVMVMGLIYSLLVVAFTLNYKAWLNWFLQATAIYLCLMVPTVDIKVTDRINPSLVPATVDNVPMGLGILASFTTQVGDWLTRTAETVFVMPNELNYSTNGMVYGARLFDATRNFIIRDAEFSTNLENHFKNCLFGDVMLYQKSLTTLAKATDLWAAVGPGSQARSQQWLERQGDGTVHSFIVTCRQAYQALDAQWGPMIEANTPLWGKEAYPKLSNALAADKLKHDVPIVSAAFTGASGSYAEVMRQNTAINAFMQARNGMSGGAGAAAIDTFAQTRADIQARNTYNSIAQQAMAWVPILNIVLTVVFFAMFPVIFPLFLMPQTGLSSLKGYTMGFFYLAAWGPLYVILHMICMTRATSAATGVAGGGVSLASYAGIGAVNGETATIAGFMLMSVPFLAAGLARGAMSIAGHSMSMLAPAQNAAEAAALEQTTGNYAYGNVSWANATSNMRQADQWSTAPTYMGGGASFGWRQDNGAMVTGFGNGQEVYDTSAAISRLGFTPTMTSGSVAEWREMASEAHRQAQAYENAANEILTATHANRSAWGTSAEHTRGWDSSSGSQANSSVEQFDRRTGSSTQGLEERSMISQSERVSGRHDRQAQISDQVSGTIGAGVGGRGKGGGGGKGLPGISGSVSKSGSQMDTMNWTTDDSRSSDSGNTSSSGVRDEHASGTGASMSDGTYARSGVFARASTTNSSSTSTEDSLALAKSYSETARRLDELSQQLSRDASYAETHGMQLSENLSQDLAQWYRHQQVANPGLDAPELWATDLTDQQRAVRQEMITRWMHDKQTSIRSEIEGQLHAPELVDVHRPSVDSAADVRAAYRPQGVGGLPVGPGSERQSGAADIIEAGKAELEGTRAAAQTMRGQRVQGAADVQGEVNRGRDHGFFHDPKLRE